MDRRSLLTGAGLAAGTALAAPLAAPAYAQGKRQLKMVTTWPKGLPGLGTLAENTAKRITEATEGQIAIKVYAGGELIGPFEAFDAVSQGSAEMYHGAEYYWQGKSIGFNFFTAVPFGLNAAEYDAWLNFGGGQALWDELSARFKIKAFNAGNTGVQMGGWYNREILSVEDFKGLKIRMPGLGGEVMRRLGAAAVSIPGGDIYQALQTTQIDATEWVGPWNDRALGFQRVAKYYYWPGWHEPGSALALGINKDVWDSFTKHQQTLIAVCCQAETHMNLAEFNHRNAGELKKLQDAGVALRRFPDPVLKALGETSEAVVKEVVEAAKDELVTRIYQGFLEARRIGTVWGEISEEGYAQARRLALGAG
ncbi:MAG: TRAP transporter substrate-binding protein [Alphaproteobacteria bacterium]|nr:TRAP transporter substrate-binding protein [Alphaproteobacteria bacterium]